MVADSHHLNEVLDPDPGRKVIRQIRIRIKMSGRGSILNTVRNKEKVKKKFCFE